MLQTVSIHLRDQRSQSALYFASVNTHSTTTLRRVKQHQYCHSPVTEQDFFGSAALPRTEEVFVVDNLAEFN